MTEQKFEKVQGVAMRTLEKIEALGLFPTPENFELWYKYYDGDAEIVGAIDKISVSIDEALSNKLYKRFLQSSAHEDSLRRMSDAMSQAINEVHMMFETAQSNTTEFSGSLSEASETIKSARSLEDISAAMSKMMRGTKEVLKQNHALEEQLSSSSSQMAELRHNLAEVRKEAMTDGLTGLSNRKSFDSYLMLAMSEARENSSTVSLLMMDIDHFKKFNDTHGHLVGDQVLRLVSRGLKDGIKGRDFAARYGGEEFAIILPDTPIEAAAGLGDALRRAIAGKEVLNRTTGENLGQITMSVGVSCFEGASDTPEKLVSRADEALYDAKEAGRNQVKIYDPDL